MHLCPNDSNPLQPTNRTFNVNYNREKKPVHVKVMNCLKCKFYFMPQEGCDELSQFNSKRTNCPIISGAFVKTMRLSNIAKNLRR